MLWKINNDLNFKVKVKREGKSNLSQASQHFWWLWDISYKQAMGRASEVSLSLQGAKQGILAKEREFIKNYQVCYLSFFEKKHAYEYLYLHKPLSIYPYTVIDIGIRTHSHRWGRRRGGEERGERQGEENNAEGYKLSCLKNHQRIWVGHHGCMGGHRSDDGIAVKCVWTLWQFRQAQAGVILLH